jgi:hypothetical protein
MCEDSEQWEFYVLIDWHGRVGEGKRASHTKVWILSLPNYQKKREIAHSSLCCVYDV